MVPTTPQSARNGSMAEILPGTYYIDKIIRPDVPNRKAIFVNEIGALLYCINKGIRHTPRLAMVIKSKGENFPRIRMEKIPGETLEYYLQHTGPIDPILAYFFTRQITEFLEDAETHGLVHRDLKPANIMLQPNGKIRITDFGSARYPNSPDITPNGEIVGSPGYWAPELRFQGRYGQNKSTDLYSIGVILYMMITGSTTSPFSSRTPEEWIKKVEDYDAWTKENIIQNPRMPNGFGFVYFNASSKRRDLRNRIHFKRELEKGLAAMIRKGNR